MVEARRGRHAWAVGCAAFVVCVVAEDACAQQGVAAVPPTVAVPRESPGAVLAPTRRERVGRDVLQQQLEVDSRELGLVGREINIAPQSRGIRLPEGSPLTEPVPAIAPALQPAAPDAPAAAARAQSGNAPANAQSVTATPGSPAPVNPVSANSAAANPASAKATSANPAPVNSGGEHAAPRVTP